MCDVWDRNDPRDTWDSTQQANAATAVKHRAQVGEEDLVPGIVLTKTVPSSMFGQ
jgi:hypothetical protein